MDVCERMKLPLPPLVIYLSDDNFIIGEIDKNYPLWFRIKTKHGHILTKKEWITDIRDVDYKEANEPT